MIKAKITKEAQRENWTKSTLNVALAAAAAQDFKIKLLSFGG